MMDRPSREIGTLLAALCLAFSLTGVVKEVWPAGGIDFYQFWAVGEALDRLDPRDVYANAERQRLGTRLSDLAAESGSAAWVAVARFRPVLETYSTPFLYTVFRLLSTGDYETDLAVYRCLQLLAQLGSIALLCRLLGYGRIESLLAMTLLTAWFEPFLSDLRVGNVNSLQLAAVAVGLWLSTRRSSYCWLASGGTLGAAVMFKPNLVLAAAFVGLLWIFRGKARAAALYTAGAAIAVLVALCASFASFGTLRCWNQWLDAMRTMPPSVILVDLGNLSLRGLVLDWTGRDPGAWLAPALGVVALAGVWRLGSSRRQALATALAAALGCLAMLLIARLAWLHYYVLAIPAILVSLRALAASRAAAAIGTLALALSPLVNLGLIQKARALGASVCLGTAILFVLVLAECLELRRAPEDSR